MGCMYHHRLHYIHDAFKQWKGMLTGTAPKYFGLALCLHCGPRGPSTTILINLYNYCNRQVWDSRLDDHLIQSGPKLPVDYCFVLVEKTITKTTVGLGPTNNDYHANFLPPHTTIWITYIYNIKYNQPTFFLYLFTLLCSNTSILVVWSGSTTTCHQLAWLQLTTEPEW